jgi:hypothetical protein
VPTPVNGRASGVAGIQLTFNWVREANND